MLSRRAEICRTAAQIFQERGYDATSVSDIARALGITKAGLYHYFESKEALLFEITAYGLDRVRDDVMLQVRGIRDPEERLRQVDTTVATFSLIGTILWLPRWFRQNGRLSQEAVAKEIANIALGGLLEPTPSRRRARRAARTSAAKASSRPRRAKARKRT
jgi:AcrR family transcriptional regulator